MNLLQKHYDRLGKALAKKIDLGKIMNQWRIKHPIPDISILPESCQQEVKQHIREHFDRVKNTLEANNMYSLSIYFNEYCTIQDKEDDFLELFSDCIVLNERQSQLVQDLHDYMDDAIKYHDEIIMKLLKQPNLSYIARQFNHASKALDDLDNYEDYYF